MGVIIIVISIVVFCSLLGCSATNENTSSDSINKPLKRKAGISANGNSTLDDDFEEQMLQEELDEFN